MGFPGDPQQTLNGSADSTCDEDASLLRQMEVLLDAVPTAAYLCDAGGRIAHFNDAAVRLWGRVPQRLGDQDLYCGSFRVYTSDGALIPHDKCWVAAALRTGEPQAEQEVVLERPEGLRLTVLAKARPLRRSDGKLLGAVSILVDVSEQKRLLASLRASERRLDALVAATPECVKLVDAEGTIVAINPAGREMLEADGAEEVRGASIYSFVAAEHQAAYREMNRRVCTGVESTLEFDLIGLKGGRRRMESRAVPLRGESGDSILHLSVALDVTRAKALESSLHEVNRRKDEFLAMLAHELRNPLAPLAMGLELLRMAEDDPARSREVRYTMKRQVDQLVRLVDDLLEVSRITSGKAALRMERVALSDVVADALEVVRPTLLSQDHTVSVGLCDTPIVIEADPVRLTQVFANLLTNAIRYTPAGGAIEVHSAAKGDHAVVTVRDSGRGLHPEMLERIFDAFVQGSSEEHDERRGQGGLGLGLALVRSLVDMHGGTVRAHSDGPGRGSRFVVRLPLARPASRPERPGPEAAQLRLPRLRVLVVDDNADATQSLASLLGIYGQTVRVAADGSSGLQEFGELRPDVAFLDIGLPDISGYEVARRIREQKGGAAALLVAVTGWGQESDVNRALEAGFDYHVVKPATASMVRKFLMLTDARTRGVGHAEN